MVYVILGMHKSGTTLVSQILHHSGINMVDQFTPSISYSEGNQYERISILNLNNQILRSDNINSLKITAPDDLTLSPYQKKTMEGLIKELCDCYGDKWGFKDPRTTLLYPLWSKHLPKHKVIAIFRNPHELWMHYRPKKTIRKYREGIIFWRTLQRWSEYNIRIIRYIREGNISSLVLNYHGLMTGYETFNQLEKFVGMPLDDQRNIDLYHHRSDSFQPFFQILSWFYQKFSGHRINSIIDTLKSYQTYKNA